LQVRRQQRWWTADIVAGTPSPPSLRASRSMRFCAAQTYASAYTGHARINRMLFIADNAPTTQMQLEALKIAAEEARQVWRAPTSSVRPTTVAMRLAISAEKCGVRTQMCLRVRVALRCGMLTETFGRHPQSEDTGRYLAIMDRINGRMRLSTDRSGRRR